MASFAGAAAGGNGISALSGSAASWGPSSGASPGTGANGVPGAGRPGGSARGRGAVSGVFCLSRLRGSACSPSSVSFPSTIIMLVAPVGVWCRVAGGFVLQSRSRSAV